MHIPILFMGYLWPAYLGPSIFNMWFSHVFLKGKITILLVMLMISHPGQVNMKSMVQIYNLTRTSWNLFLIKTTDIILNVANTNFDIKKLKLDNKLIIENHDSSFCRKTSQKKLHPRTRIIQVHLTWKTMTCKLNSYLIEIQLIKYSLQVSCRKNTKKGTWDDTSPLVDFEKDFDHVKWKVNSWTIRKLDMKYWIVSTVQTI